MTRRRTIPARDADFHVKQKEIIEATVAHRTEWLIDDEFLDNELLPKQLEWNEAWQAYENPVTRSTHITFVKNRCRREYEQLLRLLVQYLAHNMRVSNYDQMSMGIMIRPRRPTPTPSIRSYPAYRVDTSLLGHLRIYFRDSESAHRAKPRGVHAVEMAWAVLDAPPVDVKELVHSSTATRTPLTLAFEGPQRGSTLYFSLRWENNVGEKGSWSAIGSAIIP
ncbi:MAG: hypothetical protein LBF90_05315 [Prevotellaceae bacterium]|jgi:hypothetical protein|nr:hypothetical protein [Prevotellaceae bacterium]